ncbi:MAG: hypothetical protein M3O23_11625 [Actinomycetota bacterium]|nr:hypothetical protein [Actinomycetota bacterium]
MTLPARPRWYHALPEATATVECEGDRHQVSWRRGKLVLEAHDLAAERTMEVLGGEPCVCMRVLRLWQEQFGMPPELFAQLQTWLGENAFLAPPEFSMVRELSMVLGWEREWRKTFFMNRKHEQLLQGRLKERATPSLRQHLTHWKERSGARVVGAATVQVLRSDQPSAVTGRMDRVAVRASASLVPRWITDVWVKGIAVVDGAFVLEVVEAISWSELRVRAVRWEPGAEGQLDPVDAPAQLSYRGQAWWLAWDDDAPPAPPP